MLAKARVPAIESVVVDQLCVKFLEKNARRSRLMRTWGPSALAGDKGGEEEDAYRQEPDQEDSV